MTVPFRREAWLAKRLGARLEPMRRRAFLRLGGLGGLALGWACSSDESGAPEALPNPVGPVEHPAPSEPRQHEINAYVRIGEDESVSFFVGQSEMGQGVLTSLPMLIAEELDVAWERVRSEHPIASQAKYGNQFTAGSGSLASSYVVLRQIGAAARQMLLQAAAQRWSVAVALLRTDLGVVFHDASGRNATYGELAELAATLESPEDVPLKDEREFRIIGTARSQLGARAKASGTAQFGIDVKVEGMLTCVVARSPALGGSVASFDASASLAVPGVRRVVQIPTGVAVLADHFWAAVKGRDALVVTFAAGPNDQLNTDQLRLDMLSQMERGVDIVNVGDAEQVIAQTSAERRLDVAYQLPYLAHAPMEPLNAAADVRADTVEIWAGTQAQTLVVDNASLATGIPVENITLHVPLLGGGFGRRTTDEYVQEAIHASMAASVPVKLMYTREDEMRAAHYRPMNANRVRGSLDAEGWPTAWIHDVVVQPIFPGELGAIIAAEGSATNYPYAMPNRRVTWRDPGVQVPVSTWRSVGASHNTFVVESFLDELALLGNKDPLELRLRLLAQSSDPAAARHATVLRDVANRAGWNGSPPEGRARGIAVHQTFGTIVAEVAEVSVANGRVRVHKVWATVDCGRVVNPLGVEAQLQGAIIYGLTAALYGKIDIDNGRPVQGNFDSYRLLRMSEAPEIDMAIIDSGEPLTGMGEPGTPPIAPAVCNALYRLTGQRIRSLPIELA